MFERLSQISDFFATLDYGFLDKSFFVKCGSEFRFTLGKFRRLLVESIMEVGTSFFEVSGKLAELVFKEGDITAVLLLKVEDVVSVLVLKLLDKIVLLKPVSLL